MEGLEEPTIDLPTPLQFCIGSSLNIDLGDAFEEFTVYHKKLEEWMKVTGEKDERKRTAVQKKQLTIIKFEIYKQKNK